MDKIAKILLEIKAIFLRPNYFFTFTSGIKSPIYCDNRLILSYPHARLLVTNELTKLIQQKYPEVNMVVGVATAGIPYATLIADRLGIPAGYVRTNAKKHGLTNQIEGKINKKAKVVIIEDLISTGSSVFKTQDILQKAGVKVIGVAAIFTYGVPQVIKNFAKRKLPFKTLTNFDILITMATKEKYISESEKAIVLAWKKDFDYK